MMSYGKIAKTLQDWVKARRRHRLSHAHVQMARELGMNPLKLGKFDNHRQEPWKAPLPIFIEDLYFKRFGWERPEKVVPIEEWAIVSSARVAARREERRARREAKRDAERIADTAGNAP